MFSCAQAPLPTRAAHAVSACTLLVPPTHHAPIQAMRWPSLLLLREGGATVHRRDGGVDHYRAGCSAIYPDQADFHGDRWSAPQGARYSVIEFPPEVCRAWLQRDEVLLPAGTPLRHLEDARVVWWLDEIERHCTQGEPFGELYTEGLTFALVSYLDGALRRQGDGTERPRATQRRAVRELAGYIDAHLEQPLRVAELAAACGYSPAHFARAFRETFGQPVHRYVLGRRIQRARTLLTGDASPIAEVALACGFASQAHLTAAFRRETGITPGAWRRQGA